MMTKISMTTGKPLWGIPELRSAGEEIRKTSSLPDALCSFYIRAAFEESS
jgi:hypothetical protein